MEDVKKLFSSGIFMVNGRQCNAEEYQKIYFNSVNYNADMNVKPTILGWTWNRIRKGEFINHRFDMSLSRNMMKFIFGGGDYNFTITETESNQYEKPKVETKKYDMMMVDEKIPNRIKEEISKLKCYNGDNLCTKKEQSELNDRLNYYPVGKILISDNTIYWSSHSITRHSECKLNKCSITGQWRFENSTDNISLTLKKE